MSNRTRAVFIIVFLVLLIDQTLKIWVKTNMEYGQEFGILGLSLSLIHI